MVSSDRPVYEVGPGLATENLDSGRVPVIN